MLDFPLRGLVDLELVQFRATARENLFTRDR